MSDYDYERRVAEALFHLSGGRLDADDIRARGRHDAEPERLTASDVLRMHRPLAGSHSVSRTVRGSWQPLNEREPIDWARAGWLRDPTTGRFRELEPHERDDG